MSWLLNAIASIGAFFIDTLWGFILGLIDWLIDLVTEDLVAVIFTMLPDGTAEYLQTMDLTLLDSIIGPIGWWFPFWGIVTIYFVAYGFVGSVRLVRFLIGLIPGVDG